MSQFAWDDFLLLAKQLSGDTTAQPHADALARTAISRAYYAAYHLARAAATADGFVSPGFDAHSALVDYCAQRRTRDWLGLSENLKRLRRQRNAADYDYKPTSWANEVRQAVFWAQAACDQARRVQGA